MNELLLLLCICDDLHHNGNTKFAHHLSVPFPVRRTRLVLRWVTVSGSIPGAGHLFQYVTNQPPKANSAFHPSGVGK